MNAEALIGKTLGTCTLQQLIGQGGMGAVYLAQQSRPRRQVAVKVLLPVQPLSSNQRAAFLERFRRETDAAASLVHPNIMPVHEYGEGDGLVYLVMPYISGGTLRDELEREGPLPLAKIMNYMDQLAAALDCAHETGVIHRDIKPANIIKTPEGRLLLSDFGLVKIAAESQGDQARITGVGMPIGTPDYMSPEQAMGLEIDVRADLYSLGVVLYQMVTGVVPFRGDLPMQIAMQHLHMPPPSPRSLRSDLPFAAEQAILCVLSKRPNERYPRAQDLSSAFRQALEAAGVQLDHTIVATSDTDDDGRSFKKRGLFDPMWQGGSTSERPPVDLRAGSSFTLPTLSGFSPPTAEPAAAPAAFSLRKHTPLPSAGNTLTDSSFPSPSKTRSLLSGFAANASASFEAPSEGPIDAPPVRATRLLGDTQTLPWRQPEPSPAQGENTAGIATSQGNPYEASAYQNGTIGSATRILGDPNATGTFPLPGQTGMLPATGSTSALMIPTSYDGQGSTTSMKLIQSVKVVQIPVAGEPGRFMTGFMPVVAPPVPTASPNPPEEQLSLKNKLQKNMKVVIAVAAVLLILLGSSTFAFVRFLQHPQTTSTYTGPQPTPNATATLTAQASATAQANIILTDSLAQNSNDWPEKDKAPVTYVFKDGAYHLAVNDANQIAIAIYPNQTFGKQLGYSITLWEVKGDDSNHFNWYGVFLRYSKKQANGKDYQTFYAFRIDPKDGKYWFSKFDGSATTNQWTDIQGWSFGKEYHSGQGDKNKNTLKVVMNADKYTFMINGTQIGVVSDSSLSDGSIGMMVNRNGTEVAFSDMILTYN